MSLSPPAASRRSGGIYVGNVGGDLTFDVVGDMVAGDKVTNITEIIQISPDVITQQRLIVTSPYRHLDRFDDEDRDLFFGRDQLIRSLLEQIGEKNVLLVLGASGSGKSSAIRAGLLPALSQLIGPEFRYFTFVPDVNPFESLRSALHSRGFTQSDTRELANPRSDSPSKLIRALQRKGNQWLFFVDQFEELFTVSEAKLRDTFIASLVQLANEPERSAKLVLAMRADFFDRLSPFPEFANVIEKNIDYLADMHPDELWLAIEQPAARHGVIFEPGLVKEIINDVQGQAGSLPLLQYTLSLLWEAERRRGDFSDRKLSAQTYRELGGVRGALQKRADEIYNSYGDHADSTRSTPKQKLFRHIFMKLVNLAGDGSQDAAWRPVRRRVMMLDFSNPNEHAVVGELVNEKLLVSNREGCEAIVEVAHEALFTSWARLKDWIEVGKQVIFVKNRLSDDAFRWEKRMREDSGAADEELLSGSRLAQALEMQSRGDFVAIFGGLSETETQFLSASTAFRERRIQEERERQHRELVQAQQRADEQSKAAARQRRLTMAMVGMSLLAIVAAAFFFWQKSAADRAKSVAVAAKHESDVSRSTAETASERATMNERSANRQLAEAGWIVAEDARGSTYAARKESPIKAVHYLLRTAKASAAANDESGARDASLAASIVGVQISGSLVHDGPVENAAISPDGRRILTCSDNIAQLWSATDCERIGKAIQHALKVYGAVFSPDGKRVLTWSADGTAKLSDAGDGTPVGQPMEHETFVGGALYSVDGLLILTWSGNAAHLWNANDGKPVGEPMTDVSGATYSLDGKKILTWGDDGARLWDSATGRPIGQVMEHEHEPVYGACYSKDGKRILTWSQRNVGVSWNASDGKPAGPPMDFVDKGLYSPDGKRILSWYSSTAHLLDANTGKPVGEEMKHEEMITGGIYSPDGKQILTWSQDHTARFWNANDGKPVGKPMRHDDMVSGGLYSPDGKYILTWSQDHTARLWKVSDCQPACEPMRHEQAVQGALYRNDGNVLTWSSDGIVRFWNIIGRAVGEPMMHQGDVFGVLYSPDEQRILTLSDDGTARLWNASNSESVGQPMRHKPNIRIEGARYSADGRRILTWSEDDTARLWDSTDGRPIGQPMKHANMVIGATYSMDRQRILTWSVDGTARLWSAVDGTPVGQPMKHNERVHGAEYRADGRQILTWSGDGTVRLWNENGAPVAVDGAPVAVTMGNGGPEAHYSADGRRILTWSGNGTARLLDASDGKPIGEPMKHERSVVGARYAIDGKRILTWSEDDTARLWDANDGKLIGEPMKHGASVRGAVYSPDGLRILTWAEDGIARLWNAADASPVSQPMKHGEFIAAALFSPNGQRILTWSGYDAMARLWKANDGTAVGQPMMHGARVEGACFSSDGKRILTWSLDGTARLWCAGNNQCIAVFKHTGSMNSAWFNRAETRLLTVGSNTAQLWDISLDENIPIEERILEFEVRSATTIGSDGDVKVLSVSEWEKKKAKLLDDEIRLAKAIVLPGDARSLTSSELSSKQHELTELRRRLSK